MAANAQVLSPRKTTSVTIDGKKITVGYGAPSMRGRKVMGRLVPYGEVWCAGATTPTSLDTEADLDIGGLKVPKGSYTLWALPNSDEWRFIVNKVRQWHTEYHEDPDLGRVKMSVNGPGRMLAACSPVRKRRDLPKWIKDKLQQQRRTARARVRLRVRAFQAWTTRPAMSKPFFRTH